MNELIFLLSIFSGLPLFGCFSFYFFSNSILSAHIPFGCRLFAVRFFFFHFAATSRAPLGYCVRHPDNWVRRKECETRSPDRKKKCEKSEMNWAKRNISNDFISLAPLFMIISNSQNMYHWLELKIAGYATHICCETIINWIKWNWFWFHLVAASERTPCRLFYGWRVAWSQPVTRGENLHNVFQLCTMHIMKLCRWAVCVCVADVDGCT